MADLGQLFRDYKVEAFRLELLPQYKVTGEWENYQTFLQTGVATQDKDLIEYLADVEIKTKQGIKHTRARVLDVPINDYQIFETRIGYIPSAKLGTDIYFMDRPTYEMTFSNLKMHVRDFWLFDDKDLAFMNYDQEGRWLGYEIIIDPIIMQVCKELKEKFIASGYNLQTLVEKYSIEE